MNDLQNKFLNIARSEKISVTIFLVNGIKLQGIITSFDNFCLLLKKDNISQLIYKQAVSTIFPSEPLVLQTETENDE